jgi:hypothetical protein
MSDQSTAQQNNESTEQEAVSWGPKLFYGVMIEVLVFFWWMVIYPHGVAPHH